MVADGNRGTGDHAQWGRGARGGTRAAIRTGSRSAGDGTGATTATSAAGRRRAAPRLAGGNFCRRAGDEVPGQPGRPIELQGNAGKRKVQSEDARAARGGKRNLSSNRRRDPRSRKPR